MRYQADRPDVCQCCPLNRDDCLDAVRSIVGGDQHAKEWKNWLVRRFENPATDAGQVLRKIVRGKLGQQFRHEWEDCIQSIWLRLFDNDRLAKWLGRTDRGPFCYWFLMLASNRAIDWVRTQNSPKDGGSSGHDPPDAPRPPAPQRVRPVQPPIGFDPPDPGKSSLGALIENERRARINAKVASLPPWLQDIWELRYVQGRDWAQIIEALRRTYPEKAKKAKSGEEKRLSERTVYNWHADLLEALRPCVE